MSAPEDMRRIYRKGMMLRNNARRDDNLTTEIGLELMRLSGVCPNCEGAGEDGDDGDAAGVGAWIGECQACDGTGLCKEPSDPA
jgi:hypothetical protein